MLDRPGSPVVAGGPSAPPVPNPEETPPEWNVRTSSPFGEQLLPKRRGAGGRRVLTSRQPRGFRVLADMKPAASRAS